MAQQPTNRDQRVNVTATPDTGTQPARGPVAPSPAVDNAQTAVAATVTVQGQGAAPVTVQIKPEAEEEPTGKVGFRTIAKGALDSKGITPVGTEGEIDIALFSDRWMEPKTKGDRAKLVAAGKLKA